MSPPHDPWRARLRSATLLLLAALYLAALLTLTLLPPVRPARQDLNLIPFRSILYGLQRGGPLLVINVLGNVIAFLPVGLLLAPLVGRRDAVARSWLIVAGVAATLSASIELAQLTLTRRVSDIDDVLLNSLGALLGYGLARMLRGRDG